MSYSLSGLSSWKWSLTCGVVSADYTLIEFCWNWINRVSVDEVTLRSLCCSSPYWTNTEEIKKKKSINDAFRTSPLPVGWIAVWDVFVFQDTKTDFPNNIMTFEDCSSYIKPWKLIANFAGLGWELLLGKYVRKGIMPQTSRWLRGWRLAFDPGNHARRREMAP